MYQGLVRVHEIYMTQRSVTHSTMSALLLLHSDQPSICFLAENLPPWSAASIKTLLLSWGAGRGANSQGSNLPFKVDAVFRKVISPQVAASLHKRYIIAKHLHSSIHSIHSQSPSCKHRSVWPCSLDYWTTLKARPEVEATQDAVHGCIRYVCTSAHSCVTFNTSQVILLFLPANYFFSSFFFFFRNYFLTGSKVALLCVLVSDL